MGEHRAFGKHVRWSDAEVDFLKENYATLPFAELEAALPGRLRRVIACKANAMGLFREKRPTMTREQVLASKREQMAKRRAQDIVAARERGREWYQRNKDRLSAATREQTAKRLFWSRALRLRGVSGKDLASLWRRQKGLCALTGRKLDRTAEIDHRMPKSRGGTDHISNLQWVTHEANFAKRDMTDEEFFALCSDVFRWVGYRIEMVEEIAKEIAA